MSSYKQKSTKLNNAYLRNLSLIEIEGPFKKIAVINTYVETTDVEP